MAKFWVTKYATSGGIQEVEADPKFPEWAPTGYIRSADGFNNFYLDRDVFGTHEAAKKDAEARRLKKIKSLEKQLIKLQNLTF